MSVDSSLCGVPLGERTAPHVRWPEYPAWQGMKSRCHGKKSNPRYSGRGVEVCAEWRESFLAFVQHVGPKPSIELQLDRKDNDRGYEPGNVRWATRNVQVRNRSVPTRADRPGRRSAKRAAALLRLVKGGLEAPEKLRALRLASGLTMVELAAALGVSNPAVCDWESKHRFPDVENQHRIFLWSRLAAFVLRLDEARTVITSANWRGDNSPAVPESKPLDVHWHSALSATIGGC